MADCTTFDLLLVDWLYDELEPAEAARYARHIDRCQACWHTAEAMLYTRALMRALPQEPPPEAALAAILHQAAAQVAGARRRGLWAWLADSLELLGAHPAAAALATMVLVAGVAGALFMRGQMKMAEPSASSSHEHAQLWAGDVDMARAQLAAKGETAAAAAQSIASPSEGAAAESDQSDEDRAPRNRAAATRGKVRRDGSVVRSEASKRTEANKPDLVMPSPPAPARARASAGASSATPTGGLAATPTDVFDRAADHEAMAEAAPEPDTAPPASPGSDDKRAQPRQQTPKRAEPTWAETMHDALRTALRQEQCARAVRIADDIRAREPGYYRTRIAAGKDLASCRQPAGTQGQAGRKSAADAN